ncbi:OmpA family protein [Vannielia sp. SX4]|uniref:OmpA family protein n=1 Tax=Vannielia sp. SX4 TaxID=3463852 RepID=UPI004059A71E
MSAKFRNTTALVAAISLSIPAVAPAQQVVDRCEAGTIGISAEVADELGLTLNDEQQAALDGGASSDAVIVSNFDPAAPELCMTVAELEEMGVTEAEVVMAVEAEPTAEELGGEAAAAAEVETEEKGVLEKALDAVTGDDAAEEPAEAEVAADAEAEVEADVTAEAEPEVEAEAEATAEAEAEAEPEVEATADAEIEPEAEVTAEAEAEPEVEAEAEATAEGDDSGSALQEALNEVTGNDVATPEEAEEDAAEAEAEAAPEAEMTAEAEAEAEADAEANPAVPDVVAEIAKAIEAQSAEEADPEEQAAAAETEAPEASAATDETAEAADVEETTVTEESARSSSEEFLDKVTGAKADTSASASASNDDDGGLSDLEKALLVGLGAVVVGKALEGNGDAQVVTKSDDRVVVLEDGRYRVIRDDNELIERPGSTVRRETFQDGSTRTIVTRENGVQIITIRDPELRVLRRIRVDAEGNRTVLIDDTADVEPVDVAALPDPVAEAEVDAGTDAETLRAVLSTKSAADRRFALYQVRNIERVRKLAPAIDLDAINFRTGSAVIDPQEAEELSELGNLIAAYVEENPGEVFLVEGHTDAVGNAAFNLALSDRRAESVALALTEYFDVPPENLVVQGYGESDLKVKTLDDERANRRAAVRRITPLIASGS